jgi:hypothetical protein
MNRQNPKPLVQRFKCRANIRLNGESHMAIQTGQAGLKNKPYKKEEEL